MDDRPDDERTAWFGGAATAIGLTLDEARGAGGDAPVVEGSLVDVAVRAALSTGASVRVTPHDAAAGPRGGVGAMLRWRVPAPA